MILDELVLHDFGVFADRNAIMLTPPSHDKPVILIGGLNGAGKTTILEAVHLVLYGNLASIAARRSGSYDSYLRSLIHRAARRGDGAAVELAFHTYYEGAVRNYRVRRYWRETGSGTRERLEVLRDGELDEALTATWAEQVETFLPRGIASLFFFDGEQIESLADLERSRQVLGSVLASLLGLDIVDRLAADLTVLQRRHRAQQMPDSVRRDVEKAEASVKGARQVEEAAELAAAAAKQEVERARKRHRELRERYSTEGGDLLDQRTSGEDRLLAARADLASIDDELRDMAGGAAPLLQVTSALTELAAQARRESDAARAQVVLEVLATRDSAVVRELHRARVQASAIAAVEAFLANDRETREEVMGADSPITGLVDPGRLDFLTTGDLPNSKKKMHGLLARRADALAELDTAERMLTAIPDPEALAPLRLEREHAYDEMLRAEMVHTHHEEQAAVLRQERMRAQAICEKAMEDVARVNLSADDDRRLVDHADRIKATLSNLKEAANRRHLDRVSALILDALGLLMRKENLISQISIDPVTYAVELLGSSGQPLAAEQLSVGERQLLAVAMLWGLAKATDNPLPVVIDTPLGRLDSSHRHYLLTRYFPQASHQVVLMSTDTEIDADACRKLKPYIGRAYHLDFDPAVSATTIRPGYFWE